VIIHPDKYDYLILGNINLNNVDSLDVYDHLNGFDKDLNNKLLESLSKQNFSKRINVQYTFVDEIFKKYPTLDLNFSLGMENEMIFRHFHTYNVHPLLNYKNFICSFNGSSHVSRQLLTSVLEHFGVFSNKFCTKNFKTSSSQVIEHLNNLGLSNNEIKLLRKFFITSNEFCNTQYTFKYERFKHGNNIFNLENKITQSFVHLVSETMSTSYHPFITEKFLYSIVTRGLFVTYGQPNWHQHLKEFYGFKLYENIFDYSFDLESNPVKRLIKIMEMLLKFKTLSFNDLHELYELEKDAIEYNYNHYFSKQYEVHVKQKQQ